MIINITNIEISTTYIFSYDWFEYSRNHPEHGVPQLHICILHSNDAVYDDLIARWCE